MGRPRRHWIKLLSRIVKLMSGRGNTPQLVNQSYDQLAQGYDNAWTEHMRDLSVGLLEDIEILDNFRCLDLTCGTGFLTAQLARRVSTRPLGIDASEGMLQVARQKHSRDCDFKQADILQYLRNCEAESFDVITCGWGLGYSRPMQVIRQISRVLKPTGQVAIIDNSLFSLAGVILTTLKAMAENPDSLQDVMRVRFIASDYILAWMMRLCSIRDVNHWSGARSYEVSDGAQAVARLRSTGAAAGFEFATTPQTREEIFERFAKLLDQKFENTDAVTLTHRYIAATGTKK